MKVADASGASLSVGAVELVELARVTIGEMPAEQRDEGWRSLAARLAGQRRARARAWWSALAAGALCCGAALGAAVVWHNGQRHTPISFRIEGGDLRPGGTIDASPIERPVVRFSDGSELRLAEGTHVRVRSVDEHGARVTLGEGSAHVYVPHASGARWSFDAGPFVVGVTGTAFVLAWTSAEHRLDVRLENGSVTVGGPVSDAPIALRAGQWLTVRDSEILIRNLGASESQSNDPSEPVVRADPPVPDHDGHRQRPLKVDPGSAEGAHRGRRITATAPPEHHWTADLASGKVASIVEDALRLGLDATFAESSSDELSALADAARYTRHEEIAREALFTLRHRFPGSVHAHDAAFLLGRLAETQQDTRGALSWFETYLSDATGGTYASEALGRKMTVVQQLEGNEAARPVADSYLRLYPNGTYARAARALSVAR